MARWRRDPWVWACLVLVGYQSVAAEEAPFQDVATVAGLAFEHFNGMTGAYRLAEVTGSGVALFDYDGDGDLDVYLVQGAMLDAVPPQKASIPFAASGVPRDRLFRNDSTPGTDGASTLRFVDVTAASKIESLGYGMGVAAGDYDADGDLDLFVSNLGRDELWRNRGDGTFEEVGLEAGLGDEGWGTGAVFADFDGDGRLDLFVTRYVEVDLAADIECYAQSSRRDFCGPSAHPPTRDLLYRNTGQGSFENVSSPSGVASLAGPGLGVTAEDFDDDGRLDFLVANDGAANHLWLNQGQGRFVEDGLMSGLAVNRRGQPEASMGASLADVDGDGDDDLILTHLTGESNTFYERSGDFFEDRSLETGLGAPSQADTGFGVGWLDVELDGDLDLIVANGAVKLPEAGAGEADPFPLGQLDRLALNDGRGRFQMTGGPTDPPLLRVGRGLAVSDIDADGDQDVVVNNNSGRAALYLNRRTAEENSGRWVGLVPFEVREGRPVAVHHAERLWVRRVRVGGSYLSSHPPSVVVGLGEVPASIDVVWREEKVRWSQLEPGRWYVEGTP